MLYTYFFTRLELLFVQNASLQSPTFRFKGVEIGLCATLKYLRLWFDGKLSLHEDTKRAGR